MIKAVIAFSGKKRSGKDTYADTILRILQYQDPELHVARLAFAGPLRQVASEFFGIHKYRFHSTEKDMPLFRAEENLYRDRVNVLAGPYGEAGFNWPIRIPSYKKGEQTVKSLMVPIMPWEIIKYFAQKEELTLRDLLIVLGGQEGAVPHWIWKDAALHTLDHWHKETTEKGLDLVVSISDLRTKEEMVGLECFCEARNIKLFTFRLNPWNKSNEETQNTNAHVTETDLDGWDERFSRVLSPCEGKNGIAYVLSDIHRFILLSMDTYDSDYDSHLTQDFYKSFIF